MKFKKIILLCSIFSLANISAGFDDGIASFGRGAFEREPSYDAQKNVCRIRNYFRKNISKDGDSQDVRPETRAKFEEALKAFDIPADSIEILRNDKIDTLAQANSFAKQIRVNEKMFEKQLPQYADFVSYHEVGHIKDQVNEKLILTGIAASICSGIVAKRLCNQFLLRVIKSQDLRNGLGEFMGGLVGLYTVISHPVELAGEKAANILACEQLLKRDCIPEIGVAIGLLYDGKIRRGSHEEAESMIKFLKKNGYNVTVNKSADGSMKLNIEKNLK